MVRSGRIIRGAIEGNAIPSDFIPRMIKFFRAGMLPLGKLATTYPFKDINEAFRATEHGQATKAVLLMNYRCAREIASWQTWSNVGNRGSHRCARGFVSLLRLFKMTKAAETVAISGAQMRSSLAHYRRPVPAESTHVWRSCLANRPFGACLLQPLLRPQPM